MTEEQIPRYSLELIEWLEANIAKPSLPSSAGAFASLNEAALRQLAFRAGARSLVDFLREWEREGREEPEEGEEPLYDSILRGDGLFEHHADIFIADE